MEYEGEDRDRLMALIAELNPAEDPLEVVLWIETIVNQALDRRAGLRFAGPAEALKELADLAKSINRLVEHLDGLSVTAARLIGQPGPDSDGYLEALPENGRVSEVKTVLMELLELIEVALQDRKYVKKANSRINRGYAFVADPEVAIACELTRVYKALTGNEPTRRTKIVPLPGSSAGETVVDYGPFLELIRLVLGPLGLSGRSPEAIVKHTLEIHRLHHF